MPEATGGGGFFNADSFGDPLTMALLGAVGGLLNSSGPSRMPVSTGQVLAQGMGGGVQGAQQGMHMRDLQNRNKLFPLQAESAKQNLIAQMLSNNMADWRQRILGGEGGDVPAMPLVPGVGGRGAPEVGGAGAPAAPQGPSRGSASAPQNPAPSGPQRTMMSQDGTLIAAPPEPNTAPNPEGGPAPAAAAPQSQTLFGLRLPPNMSHADALKAYVAVPEAFKALVEKQYASASPIKQLQDERDQISASNPKDPRLAGYDFAIAKASGIDPVQNLRQGGSVIMYNPQHKKFEIVAQAPQLEPGMRLDPRDPSGGTAEPVTNFLETREPLLQQKARVEAEYDPLTVHDTGGRANIIPRSQLRNPPQAPTAPRPAAGNLSMSADGTLVAGTPAAEAAPAPTASAPTDRSKIPPLSKATVGTVMEGVQIPRAPAAQNGFLGPLTAAQNEMQKADVERLAKAQINAAEGQKMYLGAQEMLGALQRGLETGKLAPAFADLAGVAKSLGMDSLIPKSYDPDDASLFNKVSTDMVFTSLKQLGGKALVTEIEGLKLANPGLSMTRAANIELLKTALAVQSRNDRFAELATQFTTENPGAPLATFEAAFNKKYPLIDLDAALKNAARKSGWKFPGDKGAGASPKAKPGETGHVFDINPDGSIEFK